MSEIGKAGLQARVYALVAHQSDPAMLAIADDVGALVAENAELKQAIQNTLDTGMDRYIREALDSICNESANKCDVCLGDPINDSPCICGGTGTSIGEKQGLRELLFDVEKERDELKARVKELEALEGMLNLLKWKESATHTTQY